MGGEGWSQWGFFAHMRMEGYDFLCQPRRKVDDIFALLVGQPSFMRELSECFTGTDIIPNFLSNVDSMNSLHH